MTAMVFWQRNVFRITALALTLSALTPFARAAMLPDLSDPLNTEKDIAPYIGKGKLTPITCPSVPDNTQRKFSMGEVVALSLCNNPDTRSAYLSLVSSAASYGTSFAGYFPTIDASAGFSHTRMISPNSKSISRSSGISAAWTLFDFGQRELGVEIADLALASAGHSYDSTLQGSIAAALNGYYKLLTSQNNLTVTKESEKFAEASFEAAKLKHEIGQVALADELQAKSAYSQALLATQSATNQLSINKASLARLMGLAPDEALEVEELDDHSLTLEPFGGHLPELLEKAKAERLDLRNKRIALESAKTSLRKTERSNLATVTASVNAGVDEAGILRGGNSRSQGIGVNVSIPIFSGFSHTYNERKDQLSVESAKESLTATELNVTQDVWNSWHNYQTSKQSWDTSLDQLDSATQLKDVALGRYKEGIGTILDVLSAQSAYRTALQSQLTARYNLLTTRIDLVRAVGVLDLNTMRPEATVPLPAATAPETVPETTPAPPPAADALPVGVPLPALLALPSHNGPMLDDVPVVDNAPVSPVTP